MPFTKLFTGAAHRALGVVTGVGLAAALLGAPFQARAEAPVAAPPPAAAVAASNPALWVIRDADSTIYLFGSVHVLRPTATWRTPAVEAALAASDELWLEVANIDDTAAATPLIQQYGLSPQAPLSSLLTPEENAQLDEAARSVGATGAAFEPMRPWLAGLTLSVAPLLKAGYDPEAGVEKQLMAAARAAGKPIRGFETLEQHLRLFADMSRDQELAFLRSTLKGYRDATAQLDGLAAAWQVGDFEAIDRLGVQVVKAEDENLYRVLLSGRNEDWAGQIQTLLAGSGTTFIAVGSAHLAGEDSVQAYLERRGIHAERQ
ncbi:MAG TPA: TraB/GumN family protein [Caulobacteraceae bacterium]|jgi:hypothetical protein